MIKQFLEFILEYKATDRQKQTVDKWLSKKGISDKSVIDRFFNVYPKLKKKDIYSYKTYDELKQALQNAESWETAAEKKKKLKKDTISKKFGDKLIVLGLTPESTKFYGANTTWCTTMKDSNYHWLLHRIMGVEFILIDNSLPDTNPKHKLSIHLNWDKKYITVFDAENKIEFDGERHEYWDIKGLRDFLNNDEVFDWIIKEFEMTKEDAPKFIPSLIGKLIKDRELDKFFDITLEGGNPIYELLNKYINLDSYNSLEYDYLVGEVIPEWKKEFIPWFSQLRFDDIYSLLGDIRNSLLQQDTELEDELTSMSLNDHVFLSQTFLKFLKEGDLFDDIYKIPLIFDYEDEDWLSEIADSLNMDEDVLIQNSSEISDYYKNLKHVDFMGKDRFDLHVELLADFFEES